MKPVIKIPKISYEILYVKHDMFSFLHSSFSLEKNLHLQYNINFIKDRHQQV